VSGRREPHRIHGRGPADAAARTDRQRLPAGRAERHLRNELAGNISLNQELRFVETVNHWLDRGDLPAEKYTHTEIRRISLDEQLSYESKLDRSTAFIERLTARGIEAAEAFLGDLGDGHEHAAQFGFSHDEDRRRERPDYGGE
jgi:hypothetical protein